MTLSTCGCDWNDIYDLYFYSHVECESGQTGDLISRSYQSHVTLHVRPRFLSELSSGNPQLVAVFETKAPRFSVAPRPIEEKDLAGRINILEHEGLYFRLRKYVLVGI